MVLPKEVDAYHLNCHLVHRYGGRRGPDLTYIGDALSESDIVIRIVNGAVNMPAFGNALKPEELARIVAFLQSRKHPMPQQLEARK
jgi:ubiquinol-cytochrome c reductase cytochrome b subunit